MKFRTDLTEYFHNILKQNASVVFAICESGAHAEFIEIRRSKDDPHVDYFGRLYLEVGDTHAILGTMKYYYSDPAFPDNLVTVLKNL